MVPQDEKESGLETRGYEIPAAGEERAVGGESGTWAEHCPPGITLQHGTSFTICGRKGIYGITLNPGLLAVQPTGSHHCVKEAPRAIIGCDQCCLQSSLLPMGKGNC